MHRLRSIIYYKIIQNQNALMSMSKNKLEIFNKIKKVKRIAFSEEYKIGEQSTKLI